MSRGRTHDGAREAAEAAAAIDRVLRAERDAEAALVQARLDAQARVERARDDARALVNRTLERIARRQQAHALALARRIDALRARDAAAACTPGPADEDATAAAVERVAALLAGGDTAAAR